MEQLVFQSFNLLYFRMFVPFSYQGAVTGFGLRCAQGETQREPKDGHSGHSGAADAKVRSCKVGVHSWGCSFLVGISKSTLEESFYCHLVHPIAVFVLDPEPFLF